MKYYINYQEIIIDKKIVEEYELYVGPLFSSKLSFLWNITGCNELESVEVNSRLISTHMLREIDFAKSLIRYIPIIS